MGRIGYGLLAIIIALGWGTTVSASAQSAAGGDRSNPAAPGYGGALTVSAGDVLVGEPRTMIGPGAVYGYRNGSQGWEEVARLHASDGFGGDGFGTAIAVDGGTMLVSARPRAQVDGSATVYVFERSAPGSWAEVGRLPEVDVAADAGYGASLAINDDVALVGAPAQEAPGRRGGNQLGQSTG